MPTGDASGTPAVGCPRGCRANTVASPKEDQGEQVALYAGEPVRVLPP